MIGLVKAVEIQRLASPLTNLPEALFAQPTNLAQRRGDFASLSGEYLKLASLHQRCPPHLKQ